jgi:hypothetical protein
LQGDLTHYGEVYDIELSTFERKVKELSERDLVLFVSGKWELPDTDMRTCNTHPERESVCVRGDSNVCATGPGADVESEVERLAHAVRQQNSAVGLVEITDKNGSFILSAPLTFFFSATRV